jgi:hypothetical protein
MAARKNKLQVAARSTDTHCIFAKLFLYTFCSLLDKILRDIHKMAGVFKVEEKRVGQKILGSYRSLSSLLLPTDGSLRPALVTCQDVCFKLNSMGLGRELEEAGPVSLENLVDNQVGKNLHKNSNFSNFFVYQVARFKRSKASHVRNERHY